MKAMDKGEEGIKQKKFWEKSGDIGSPSITMTKILLGS